MTPREDVVAVGAPGRAVHEPALLSRHLPGVLAVRCRSSRCSTARRGRWRTRFALPSGLNRGCMSNAGAARDPRRRRRRRCRRSAWCRCRRAGRRRSRWPSGLTSTFIHVPSDVSNASFVVGPRSAVTSHFFASAVGGCCASVDVSTASGRSEEDAEMQSVHTLGLLQGSLSRLRHRYQDATERYGRQASPILRMRSASGFLRRPIDVLDRVHDAEVANRQHVGPVQAEHEEHFGRPPADALHLRQRGNHLVVGHRLERVERQRAAQNLFGEIAEVRALLAAHADGAELLVRERRQRLAA